MTPVAHRPYPPPDRPWGIAMAWEHLLFAHWRVEPERLARLLPAGLEVDTWDGSAWIGVVPFGMTGVRPRGLPAVPWISRFLELNVRTYVRAGEQDGVWFFSLDAANPVAVRGARWTFGLPYVDAVMACHHTARGGVVYSSRRVDPAAPPARLEARYAPCGPVRHAVPGSLEWFLTARYRLFAADRRGAIRAGEIDHGPWPLQPATADISRCTMLEPLGLALPDEPPHLLYTRSIDTRAWPLAPLGRDGSNP